MKRNKRKKPEPKLITCPDPGCGVMFPEHDSAGQIAHMESAHPDMIAARHRMAGIRSEYNPG